MYHKNYTEAVYSVARKSDSQKDVFLRLQECLKRRGLYKLYPRILKEVLKKLNVSSVHLKTRVALARKTDLEKHFNEIEHFLHTIEAQSTYDLTIDESLIGGFIAQGKNKRLDKSYKNKLLHAYQKLID